MRELKLMSLGILQQNKRGPFGGEIGLAAIPTGLCPPAQGCEERATLGGTPNVPNPIGVASRWCRGAAGPLGLLMRHAFSQGSSFLATLGFGSESRWDSILEFP